MGTTCSSENQTQALHGQEKQRAVEAMEPSSTPSADSPDDAARVSAAQRACDAADVGWVFTAPPNNQRTFFFKHDNLEFSSDFDNGNLIHVERVGRGRYSLYTSMDCGNSPQQTISRHWFHFAIRGGTPGMKLELTMVGMSYGQVFNFNWSPVMAIFPDDGVYRRMTEKPTIELLERPPVTPGFPKMTSASPTDPNVSILKLANLSFTFVLPRVCPLKHDHPLGHPDCPAIYLACHHPYTYDTLQRHLRQWEEESAAPEAEEEGGEAMDAASAIFYHREDLCDSLEGRAVPLLTITDRHGMLPQRMPLLANVAPMSSAKGCTQRPPMFRGKEVVVMSARVHAGECPSSHMMNGCINFLLNRRDPRARALRRNFVFFLLPMLNPDGVARGHTRVDAGGKDLNRTYTAPSRLRHPSSYYAKMMCLAFAQEKRLSLYVDMHAHANQRGAFFYANDLPVEAQIQNLLYGKLVATNTPFFEFLKCDYSMASVTSTTRTGKTLRKDSSARVVLQKETGLVHSYCIEASYTEANALNVVQPLPGADGDVVQETSSSSKAYSPSTFASVGRGLLVALLDLKGLNPLSRVAGGLKEVEDEIRTAVEMGIAEKVAAKVRIKLDLPTTAPLTESAEQKAVAELTTSELDECSTFNAVGVLPPTTVHDLRAYSPLTVLLSRLRSRQPQATKK